MVTMQVSHRNRPDVVRVQALCLKRGQAGGAAVDQHYLPFGGQVNARLPALAAAERVTAANKPHPHDSILAHPLPDHRCQRTHGGR
jgi:hypothetical protein